MGATVRNVITQTYPPAEGIQRRSILISLLVDGFQKLEIFFYFNEQHPKGDVMSITQSPPGHPGTQCPFTWVTRGTIGGEVFKSNGLQLAALIGMLGVVIVSQRLSSRRFQSSDLKVRHHRC
uniref:Uncharacterized protein n=1 Tax=Engystomops pustulosus TaxID=76066 RepID=A0AAV6YPN6_ENGPU|nr:hypothetical protein GDO81_023443 [Engystomops pustulosus]